MMLNRIKLFFVLGFIVFNAAWAQIPTDSSKIVVFVETMPEYPGGQETMYAYLNKNIKYPKADLNKSISGKVIVQFVIDTFGHVIDSKVIKSVSPTIDAEALRVINGMPQWKPGTQQGKAVNVKFTIPINFSLQENRYRYSVTESIGIIVGGLLGAAIGVWLYSLL
jgi:Ca-activated chloride channel family protein